MWPALLAVVLLFAAADGRMLMKSLRLRLVDGDLRQYDMDSARDTAIGADSPLRHVTGDYAAACGRAMKGGIGLLRRRAGGRTCANAGFAPADFRAFAPSGAPAADGYRCYYMVPRGTGQKVVRHHAECNSAGAAPAGISRGYEDKSYWPNCVLGAHSLFSPGHWINADASTFTGAGWGHKQPDSVSTLTVKEFCTFHRDARMNHDYTCDHSESFKCHACSFHPEQLDCDFYVKSAPHYRQYKRYAAPSTGKCYHVPKPDRLGGGTALKAAADACQRGIGANLATFRNKAELEFALDRLAEHLEAAGAKAGAKSFAVGGYIHAGDPDKYAKRQTLKTHNWAGRPLAYPDGTEPDADITGKLGSGDDSNMIVLRFNYDSGKWTSPSFNPVDTTHPSGAIAALCSHQATGWHVPDVTACMEEGYRSGASAGAGAMLYTRGQWPGRAVCDSVYDTRGALRGLKTYRPVAEPTVCPQWDQCVAASLWFGCSADYAHFAAANVAAGDAYARTTMRLFRYAGAVCNLATAHCCLDDYCNYAWRARLLQYNVFEYGQTVTACGSGWNSENGMVVCKVTGLKWTPAEPDTIDGTHRQCSCKQYAPGSKGIRSTGKLEPHDGRHMAMGDATDVAGLMEASRLDYSASVYGATVVGSYASLVVPAELVPSVKHAERPVDVSLVWLPLSLGTVDGELGAVPDMDGVVSADKAQGGLPLVCEHWASMAVPVNEPLLRMQLCTNRHYGPDPDAKCVLAKSGPNLYWSGCIYDWRAEVRSRLRKEGAGAGADALAKCGDPASCVQCGKHLCNVPLRRQPPF